jgi:hypothetical protein
LPLALVVYNASRMCAPGDVAPTYTERLLSIPGDDNVARYPLKYP